MNPSSAIGLGEILADIRRAEADFVDLVGLGFPEHIEDAVDVQFTGLAQSLHLNCLREGGGAVLALHSLQQILLFLLGQVGELYSGSQGDFTVIHYAENVRDQFC